MLTRRKCCCGPPPTPTCSHTFSVTGCTHAVAEATVTVYDHAGGTILVTGTTDASGNVTLTWDGSCTVYVTISAPCFNSTSQSATYTNGGTTTVNLTTPTGTNCGKCCNPPSGWIILDDNTSLTLTSIGGFSYRATYTYTRTNAVDIFCSTTGSYLITIQYQIDCDDRTGTFSVTRSWYEGQLSGTWHYRHASASCGTNATGSSVGTFSLPGSCSGNAFIVDCRAVAKTVVLTKTAGNLPDPIGTSVSVSS